MRKMGIALSLICAGLFLAPVGAHAQATRTWVSGVGDDVNPCSRTAPCRTFPGAISKTAAGGEIDTLDPGSFAAVTIVKAITLASEGSGEAGILTAGTNGVTVNCSTDPNCVVILRGLEIDGGPVGSNSLAGVKFVAGRTLMIQRCTIRNFTGGSPNGYGVSFTPNGAGAMQQLFIDDSQIVTNGQASGAGGGVFIAPTGTPNINVAITNTQVSNNNAFGIRADGTTSTGGTIAVAVTNSETSGNGTAGIAVVAGSTAGSTAVLANVSHTVITNNNVGINGNGSFATFHLGGSTLTNNVTGVKNTGATMNSFGGNLIADNPTPGPTLPIIGPF
jgi:hypothetical protein